MAHIIGHPASTWRNLLSNKMWYVYRGIEMRKNSVFVYRGRSCIFLVVLYTPRSYISNDIMMICKKSAEFVVPKGKMLGLTPSYNFRLGRNKFKGKSYILNIRNVCLSLSGLERFMIAHTSDTDGIHMPSIKLLVFGTWKSIYFHFLIEVHYKQKKRNHIFFLNK